MATEEKSFLSSFTAMFKAKPTDASSEQHADEKQGTPRKKSDATAGDVGVQATTPRKSSDVDASPPATSNTTPRKSDATTEVQSHPAIQIPQTVPAIVEPSTVKHSDADTGGQAQHSDTSGEEQTLSQDVVERADSLGSLDQQRSDEIEKAIEAAEARTAEKIEQIKTEKSAEKTEGEEQEAKNWLAKTRENIKYTFISKETEEAFGEILILFDKMFDDFPYNKVDLMFGLMMLDDYYKNAPILSSSRVEDLEFVETARYYMKFACCCYGWKFVYGILNRKTNRFFQSMVGLDANMKAIVECTGVAPKDIVNAKWTSSVFDPGHYICLCHERKTIVVAFRGTFHIRDALTDLVASNTAFMQGSAHTGLLKCANNKFRVLAPIILKIYEENPTYKLVVVGHSLGAGTASLFSLIFHEAHPEVPMHCYAYAPPGVVSPDVALSSSTQELIDSIVVGTDVVPRLSFATLTHLKKVIVKILGTGNNTFQRAFQWMSGGMGDGMKHLLKVPEAAKIEPTPVPLSDITVFPPGRLMILVPHTLGGEYDTCSSDEALSEEEEETSADKEKHVDSSNAEKEDNEEYNHIAKAKKAKRAKAKATAEEQAKKEKAENDSKGDSKSSGRPRSVSSNPVTPPSSSSNTTSSSSNSNSSSTTPTSTLAPPQASSNPLRRFSASFSQAIPLFSSAPKENKEKEKKPPKPKTVYLMEHSNASLFNEIIISPTMFTSHMPSMYDKALESCLQTMRQLLDTPTLQISVKMD